MTFEFLEREALTKSLGVLVFCKASRFSSLSILAKRCMIPFLRDLDFSERAVVKYCPFYKLSLASAIGFTESKANTSLGVCLAVGASSIT